MREVLDPREAVGDEVQEAETAARVEPVDSVDAIVREVELLEGLARLKAFDALDLVVVEVDLCEHCARREGARHALHRFQQVVLQNDRLQHTNIAQS